MFAAGVDSHFLDEHMLQRLDQRGRGHRIDATEPQPAASTVASCVQLAVGRYGEQRLLTAGNADRPKNAQRIARRGCFDAATFQSAELAAVIVAPAIDGARATPRQRPVLRSAIEPLQELAIVLRLENRVVQVQRQLCVRIV